MGAKKEEDKIAVCGCSFGLVACTEQRAEKMKKQKQKSRRCGEMKEKENKRLEHVYLTPMCK